MSTALRFTLLFDRILRPKLGFAFPVLHPSGASSSFPRRAPRLCLRRWCLHPCATSRRAFLQKCSCLLIIAHRTRMSRRKRSTSRPAHLQGGPRAVDPSLCPQAPCLRSPMGGTCALSPTLSTRVHQTRSSSFCARRTTCCCAQSGVRHPLPPAIGEGLAL